MSKFLWTDVLFPSTKNWKLTRVVSSFKSFRFLFKLFNEAFWNAIFVHLCSSFQDKKIYEYILMNMFQTLRIVLALKFPHSNVPQLLTFFLSVTLDWEFLKVHTVRSSHWRCSVGKGVLRNFAKLAGKHLWQSFFFCKFIKRTQQPLEHLLFHVNKTYT